MDLTSEELTKLAMAAGILFVAYRFIPNQAAKAAILGVAGVIAAKNIPVIQDYLV